MKTWWLGIISVILLSAFFFIFYSSKPAQVVINGKTFRVELARTSAERAQGLAGRESLDDDAGMLFIFPVSDIYAFWMKDTLIPLDIIWIDDGKIVEMTTLQPPNGAEIPKYTSQNEARYVLELKANSGFKVGDEVEIRF